MKRIYNFTFWNSLTGNVTISGVNEKDTLRRYEAFKAAYQAAGHKVGEALISHEDSFSHEGEK